MKSKIIYFVLYLVVIAELLVVIHERDLMIESLEVDKLINEYIQKLTIDTQSPNVSFTVTPVTVSENDFTFNSPNLISDEEKESLQFFAELNPQSSGFAGFVPKTLNSKSPDPSQKVIFKKVSDKAYMTFKFGFVDLPPAIRGQVATKKDVYIKYDVYCKTPRIIPEKYVALKTIEPIFSKMLTDTTTLSLIAFRYGLKEKPKIEETAKRIVVRFMLGMNPKVLFELLDNYGEKYYFGIDKNKIEGEISRIAGIVNSAGSDEQKALEYKKLQQLMINELKGKLGFSDAEDFYFEESNKLTLNVKVTL